MVQGSDPHISISVEKRGFFRRDEFNINRKDDLKTLEHT